MIEHVRMDYRLIHGQVLVAWSNTLKFNEIIVTNDKVAADPLQVTLLKSVAPAGAKVRIFSNVDAAKYINDPANAEKRLFVIVKFPEDAFNLYEAGVQFTSLNLGNQAYMRGSEKLTKTVYLMENGVKALKALHEKGVKITARMMPADPNTEIWPTIEKTFAKWL